MIDQFCSFLSCKYEACNFSALICFLNGRIKLHYIFILQSFSRKTLALMSSHTEVRNMLEKLQKTKVSVVYFIQITLRRLWVIWPNYRENLNIRLCNRYKHITTRNRTSKCENAFSWYGQSSRKGNCIDQNYPL